MQIIATSTKHTFLCLKRLGSKGSIGTSEIRIILESAAALEVSFVSEGVYFTNTGPAPPASFDNALFLFAFTFLSTIPSRAALVFSAIAASSSSSGFKSNSFVVSCCFMSLREEWMIFFDDAWECSTTSYFNFPVEASVCRASVEEDEFRLSLWPKPRGYWLMWISGYAPPNDFEWCSIRSISLHYFLKHPSTHHFQSRIDWLESNPFSFHKLGLKYYFLNLPRPVKQPLLLPSCSQLLWRQLRLRCRFAEKTIWMHLNSLVSGEAVKMTYIGCCLTSCLSFGQPRFGCFLRSN